jgi:hypothetical protein
MKKKNCRTVLARYSAQGHMAPAWPTGQNGSAGLAGARRWCGQLQLLGEQDVIGATATTSVGDGGPA